MFFSQFKISKFFSSNKGLIRLEIIFAILFEQFFGYLLSNINYIDYNKPALILFGVLGFFILILSFFVKKIEDNLRIVSNTIYLSAVLFVFYTAFKNEFSIGTFYAALLVYTFVAFMYSSKRVFLRQNIIVLSVLLFFLSLLKFQVKTPLIFIISSISVLFLAGYCLTLGRYYYKRKIKERGNLLSNIFNQSSEGLLLVNSENSKVEETNETAIKILGLKERKDIIGTDYLELKIKEKNIFNSIETNKRKIIEYKDQTIVSVVKKELSYKNDEYFLIEFSKYSNRKNLAQSFELDKLKEISDETYEILFKDSASMICIIDENDKILDVNYRLSNLLGYKRSEIIGKNNNTIDAKNYDEKRRLINQEVWKGNSQSFEKELKAKDGKTVYIEVILKKGKYFGKEVLISNSRDITERKLLREKVEFNQGKYQTLFEESPIGIAVADLQGNILDSNNSLVKLFGFSKKELLEKKISNFSNERNISSNNSKLEKLIRGEVSSLEMKKNYKTKEGKEISCLLKTILQKDKNGEGKFFLAQVVDISEIIEAKKRIIQSEKSYKDIFNNAVELLYLLNRKNLFIDVNKSLLEKYGYRKEEILGNSPVLFNAEEMNDMAIFEEKLTKAWKGENQEFLWYNKKKDGSIFPKVLQITKGEYFGEEVLIGSGRDISEQLAYQDTLEKSNKKYKDLIHSSIIGIAILKDEKIVFANQKLAELLKFKNSEELIGKERIEFIQLKDKPVYAERASKLKSGEEVEMREFKLYNSKGEEISVEIKPKLIDFEGENCVMISILDTSDKERAKQNLIAAREANIMKDKLMTQLAENRENQKKLIDNKDYTEGIIQSSLDMIFTASSTGEIDRINSAGRKQLRFNNKEQFFRKNISLLFKNKAEINKILDNLPYSGEQEMLRIDGTTFLSFVSINELLNNKKENLGLMGISRDISEIKQKENEIKEQASKLNSIIESSSHFFFTVDRNRKLVSFNKLFKEDIETKYNHSIKEGEDFYSLFTVDQKELKNKDPFAFWESKFNKAFSGKKMRFENKRQDVNGDLFFREVYLNPIYNENDEIYEVSCLGHDTTEKRLAEEQLQSSLAEKNVLLKEVHHRVKNNMQVISSILNLQSSYVKDEDTIKILKESQGRIRAMASIHERLYSTENFSNINFSSYIKDLAKSIISTYGLANKRVKLSCELDEVFLSLDLAIPCGLILNELISNSLKYAFKQQEKGEIHISLTKEGKSVILKISDNGIGFPKNLDFKRTKSLGLQLVVTLIEQIEGKITLENKKGTTFNVVFTPTK